MQKMENIIGFSYEEDDFAEEEVEEDQEDPVHENFN